MLIFPWGLDFNTQKSTYVKYSRIILMLSNLDWALHLFRTIRIVLIILVLVSIVLSTDKTLFRGMCLLFTDLRREQKV